MSAKLLPLASDTTESASIRCTKNAEQFPDSFLGFLKAEWAKDGASLQKDASEMAKLKAIKVQCHDGVRRPIPRLYLPTTRLVFIYKKYALDSEKFHFISYTEPIPPSSLGAWAFLQEHFDVRTTDDLKFYLSILDCIKRHNPLCITVYPRRIMELYLRIHSVCKASQDLATSQTLIRSVFERRNLLLLSNGWTSPTSVVLNKPTSCMPRSYLLPPPDDWEVMQEEIQELKSFYKDTLGINYFSWVTILDDFLNRRFEMTHERLHSSYSALYKLVPELSTEAVSMIKEHFTRYSYICVFGVLDKTCGQKWYKTSDCIWSGGMKVPGKVDLSQSYPELESFFTQFLKIRIYKGGVIYKQLTAAPPTPFNANNVKQLLWSLNDELAECGPFLNAHQFRLSKALPVKEIDGAGLHRARLASADAEFFIADLPFLQDAFADQVMLLDFTPQEVWRLQPLLIWAGLEPKYLSWNVEEVTCLSDASPRPIESLFTPARALGLARIASHFRSPKVESADEEYAFAQMLIRTEVFQTDGIYSCLSLKARDSSITLPKHAADIHIEDQGDALEVYLPNGPDAIEFCSMTKLPRKLVEWIMTDPATKIIGPVDEVAVSIVKSILNAKDSLTSRILDSEGIFDTHVPVLQETRRPTTPQLTQDKVHDEIPDQPLVRYVAPSTPKREEKEAETTWHDTPTPKNNEIDRKLGVLRISDEQTSAGSPKEMHRAKPAAIV